jgi:WD40 repeat protein
MKVEIEEPEDLASAVTAAYSDDGTIVVMGSSRNAVLFASATTGKIIRRVDSPDFNTEYNEAQKKALSLGDKAAADDPLAKEYASGSFQIGGVTENVLIDPYRDMVAVSGPADPTADVRLYPIEDTGALKVLSGPQHTLSSSDKEISFTRRMAVSKNGSRLAWVANGHRRSQVQIFDTASATLLRTFEAPRSTANTLALDPQGKILLTGHSDGSILLWCVESGRFVQQLQVHKAQITDLVIDPTDRMFLSGSADGTTALWPLPDAHTACPAGDDDLGGARMSGMRPIALLEGHEGGITQVLAVPSAGLVVSSSEDGTIRTWRIDGAGLTHIERIPEMSNFHPTNEQRRLMFPLDRPELQFVSHGSRLLVRDAPSNHWETWDIKARKLIDRFQGQVVPVDPVSGTVDIWYTPFFGEVLSPKARHEFSYHPDEDSPGDLRWKVSRDHTRAVATLDWLIHQQPALLRLPFLHGEDDVTLHLFSTRTHEDLERLTIRTSKVYQAQFSADGRYVVGFAKGSNPDDKSIGWWDAKTGKLVASADGISMFTDDLLLSNDGTLAICFVDSKNGHLWGAGAVVLDPTQPEGLVAMLFKGQGPVVASSLSADGKVLANGDLSGTIKLWNPRSGKAIASFNIGNVQIQQLMLSPTGRYLAEADSSGMFRLFRLDDGNHYTLISSPLAKNVFSIAFSGAEDRVAAVTTDGDLYVFDVDAIPRNARSEGLVSWARAQYKAFTRQ